MVVKIVEYYNPVEGHYVGIYVDGKPSGYIYNVTEVTLEKSNGQTKIPSWRSLSDPMD